MSPTVIKAYRIGFAIFVALFGFILWASWAPGEPISHWLLFNNIVFWTVYLYFLPAFIALKRLHRNAAAIGVLNLLLGWTLFGWVIALCWALYRDREPIAA